MRDGLAPAWHSWRRLVAAAERDEQRSLVAGLKERLGRRIVKTWIDETVLKDGLAPAWHTWKLRVHESHKDDLRGQIFNSP